MAISVQQALASGMKRAASRVYLLSSARSALTCFRPPCAASPAFSAAELPDAVLEHLLDVDDERRLVQEGARRLQAHPHVGEHAPTAVSSPMGAPNCTRSAAYFAAAR